MFPTLQVSTFCGPEKESCVGNQTLRDKSCLVPCTGLYADITDDNFKQTSQAFDQNVLKGNVNLDVLLNPHKSGFHTLTEELNNGVYWMKKDSKERLYVALQQIFPTSAEQKVDEVKPLRESYHKYKMEYLKHLSFNPEEENLSKCISN